MENDDRRSDCAGEWPSVISVARGLINLIEKGLIAPGDGAPEAAIADLRARIAVEQRR
jgi:hypothetical protein